MLNLMLKSQLQIDKMRMNPSPGFFKQRLAEKSGVKRPVQIAKPLARSLERSTGAIAQFHSVCSVIKAGNPLKIRDPNCIALD
ncbi:MAG: hypothetical protein D6742_16145 [Cyanobacteria bacterium J069]|nr:MAG: hypothetical protein D6742_16145 [Cyanobacteria bacterium J069]